MKLYDKVRSYIDWGNHYTIQKALNTLGIEFDRALKTNNQEYAKSIVDVVKRIYDEFSGSFRESEDYGETMSYSQRMMANKMRHYIGYLVKKLNKLSQQQRIKQIIETDKIPNS